MVDVGAATELDAKQNLDRIRKLLRQVDDRGIETDKLGRDHRQRQ